MSVHVQGLTKIYGSQKAVHDLTFEAKAGQILGFLGPNGAGKSTTMKMITGYIAPSSGDAIVAGHSILTDPLAVRQSIGYLPEHNPLYKDMYVREYLSFVAGLHKIKNRKRKVDELIDMTGLGREQHKIVGALSKGYRQRVGLAQAMIHDPQVLILDEPTSGLDMNQLVDIRALIKQLGQEKTVIFSTHIMQEVQALCDRVIIIDRGELVADDDIGKLQSRISGHTIIHIELAEAIDLTGSLSTIEGVQAVEAAGERTYMVSTTAGSDLRAVLSRSCTQAGATIIGMQQEQFSVEQIFQELTTKSTANA